MSSTRPAGSRECSAFLHGLPASFGYSLHTAVAQKHVVVDQADREHLVGIDVANIRPRNHLVAHIRRLEALEIERRLLLRVGRSNQNLRRAQLVGHDLEVECCIPVKPIAAR